MQFEVEDIKNAIEVLKNRKTRLNEKHAELEKIFVAADKEKKYIDSQLEDYKQKDASGLVREEKNITQRINQIFSEKENLEKLLAKLKDDFLKLKTQYENNIEKIKNLYKEFLSKFTKMSVSMPFSIGDLIASFEKFIHLDIKETIEAVKTVEFLMSFTIKQASLETDMLPRSQNWKIHLKNMKSESVIQKKILFSLKNS